MRPTLEERVADFFKASFGEQHERLAELLAQMDGLAQEAKRSMGRRMALADLNRFTKWLQARSHRRPIPMILFCPKCHVQHVDELEPAGSRLNPGAVDIDWSKRPHRTHLCKMPSCGHMFRPSNFATVGVAELPPDVKRPERGKRKPVMEKPAV